MNKHKLYLNIFYSVILFLSLIFFCSCGEIVNAILNSSTAVDLTDSGWLKYQQGDYNGAIADFNNAILQDSSYADAYNGLGWANAKLSNLSVSISNFTIAISLSDTLYEAYAGRSFAYTANNEHQYSIDDGQEVIDNEPNFIFSHNSSVDIKDVRIVMAQNYCYKKSYTEACNQVKAIDSSFNNCSDTSALLKKIMELESQYGGH